MAARIPLNGLAPQTLLDVTSERSTYVPVDANREIAEARPAVLVFSKSRLSIVNPFVLKTARGASLPDFIGATTSDVYSTDDELCVAFTDGDRISISLRDEDFTRPEAAVYDPNDGSIVVFN